MAGLTNYPHRVSQLRDVEKALRKQKWFAQDWKVSLSLWPNDEKPTCAMFQLYRKGWFNEDTCGIHIETWLTDAPIEAQKIPVLMHVLHRKTFPGGEDANAVSKPLVNDPVVQRMVKEWKGYKLGAGGMTPFRANKKFTEENVVAGLIAEFEKTRTIGDHVDTQIAKLRKS